MPRKIAVVKAIYAAFSRGDVPGVLAYMSTDVDWDWGWASPAVLPALPGRGHPAVVGFFTALSVWQLERFEMVNFLSGGNEVVVSCDVVLRSRRTGRTHGEPELHLWTFGGDGKISRMRHFYDPRGYAAIL